MKWPWQKPPKKLVLCMVAPSATKRIAEELGEQRTFTVYPILYGDYDEIIDDCMECSADILAIEVAPDADDCERDVSSRCDLAIELREKRPQCRVYLLCRSTYAHVEPALQEAQASALIDGYHIGEPFTPQIRKWLTQAERG